MTDRAHILHNVSTRMKLTQAECGARYGVEAVTIGTYERGTRPVPDPVWRLIQRDRVMLGDLS